jgi:hypothetical protein
LKELDLAARQRHPEVKDFVDLKSADRLALMLRTLEATPSDFSRRPWWRR